MFINRFILQYGLYKKFLFNINSVSTNEGALLFTFYQNEKMEIMFLIDKKLSYFTKIKDQPMTLVELDFNLSLKEINKLISIKELKVLILKLKYGANVVNRETIIDVMVNSLNNKIRYYGLTQPEVYDIYQCILRNKDFFMKNTSFMIDAKNQNLWAD